jgi:hypothetical protein
MITELLGLAGSGVLGSLFGMISDHVSRKKELEMRAQDLEIMRRSKEMGTQLKYLNSDSGFATSEAYSGAFMWLVRSYCICLIICIIDPSLPLYTFSPDNTPSKFSIFFGIVSWERPANFVYEITTGGVAYGLLHPLAFQIGSVITGINPMGATRR